MQPLHFSFLFVAFLMASLLLRLWLASRQIRHVVRHSQQVPAPFASRISQPAHQRAATYTVARVRLAMLELGINAVLLLILTLLGGLQHIDEFWMRWLPTHPLLQQLATMASTLLLISVAELPLDWWRHFRLEARFGFNRMTLGLFVADHLKGLLLGAVLGLPLLAGMIWVMQSTGSAWWLWAWAFWIGFSTLMLLIFPAFIAPLFNRFEPLPDGPVKERILALLARCHFSAGGLFVMDGSRRSAHGNAYFTGFGQSRRIVFFDTLLARLEVDEVEAVLAHELGHFKKRHIIRRMVLQAVLSLACFALLGWLSGQFWFYQGLGIAISPLQTQAPAGVALLLFFLALPVFTLPLRPLMAWLSRRDEFEADAFAVDHASGTALVSALTKIYEDNAATLTPDPLHSAFYDSHPPATLRIAHIEARLAQTQPGAA